MAYKVVNINNGNILKTGFSSEEEATEWLEDQDRLHTSNFMVEEIDPDEEELSESHLESLADEAYDEDGGAFRNTDDDESMGFDEDSDGDENELFDLEDS